MSSAHVLVSHVSVLSTTVILYSQYILLSFFFSSRRRHTRWPRDWSSDVCSSDLHRRRNTRSPSSVRGSLRPLAHRSEERRVGKECRSWWSPMHYKKKADDRR